MLVSTLRGSIGILSLAPIGARHTTFEFTLSAGRYARIRLGDYGIPTDATVLLVGYTPQGDGVFPYEAHTNFPVRHRYLHEWNVYGAPATDATATEVRVLALVLWVPAAEDDQPWASLVDAFSAMHRDDYDGVIIAANVAVEATLTSLVRAVVSTHAGVKRADEFIQDVGYGHMLNALLPTLLGSTACPRLDDAIRGSLNRLRGVRNEIAHGGRPEKPLTKEDVASFLSAAVFGVHYVRLARTYLRT